jgi:hypothetical protein
MLKGNQQLAPVPSYQVHLPSEHIRQISPSHGEIHSERLQPVWWVPIFASYEEVCIETFKWSSMSPSAPPHAPMVSQFSVQL